MVIRTMLVAVLVTGSGKGEIMLSMARCAMLMVMVEARLQTLPFSDHETQTIQPTPAQSKYLNFRHSCAQLAGRFWASRRHSTRKKRLPCPHL